MAADEFCKLVRSKHPDTPLAQLERDAGVQPSRTPLRHWFRESTKVEFPPAPATIHSLSRITGLEPADIYLAFRRDSKYLSGVTDADELNEFERTWVDVLRGIPPEQVALALRMIAGLRESEHPATA